MRLSHDSHGIRRKAVWGPKRTLSVLLLFILGFTPQAFAGAGLHSTQPGTVKPGVAGNKAEHPKLDKELTRRAERQDPNATSSTIVRLQEGALLPAQFRPYKVGGKLDLINAFVLDVPNRLLKSLAVSQEVFDVHFNRPVHKHNYRTSLTVGALAVQQAFGLTGAGIGVAVIDSGITAWHDDLSRGNVAGTFPYGDQRVSKFVDFVHGQGLPYDDNGHGTHVSGIIAGNGYDSNGQKAGVAPEASIVSLKVLDANGVGTIGNIIAALDWAVAHKAAYNIRVINLSVGASIRESYWTDPLTLAAKGAVDAGIVVVSAAGNMGKNHAGQIQYGAITAPGNAPWVLTVGASSTKGTPTRGDDVVGTYSSRGPTNIDYGAKPDLVAPGTGTVSLAAPGSNFYLNKPANLVAGFRQTAFKPYLTLTGTSMAAPVVAGTVALMLQANPALTPNGVKAILQYTAQNYAGYNALTQGTGFLNTLGAVRLARFYATARLGDKIPIQKMWGKHILWGNHMLKRGVPVPTMNAFKLGVVWGSATTASGANIVWGSQCVTDDCDNIVWGSAAAGDDNIVWGSSADGDNIVWGSGLAGDDDNIVWGSDCGGGDCANIVWGSFDSADNIVWGSAAPDDNIVWGSNAVGDDNIVWGSSGDDSDNIVWGSSGDDNDNIVWGSSAADDNIVWGSGAGDDNIVWGSDASGATVWADLTTGAGGSVSSVSHMEKLTDAQLLKLIIGTTAHLPPPIPVPTTLIQTVSSLLGGI
jgi:serine protease AprX